MPFSSVAALALVVVLGDPVDPTLQAMGDALREALGTEVVVRVSMEAADEATVQPQATVQPEATVQALWDDISLTATLLIRAQGLAQRRTQVRFAPSDAASDRGRALGYIAAAWLQSEARARRPAPEPAANTPVGPPATPPPRGPLERDNSANSGAWRVSLAAYGVLTLGLGDDNASTSYGAGAITTWWADENVRVHARFEARTGRVGRAQATASWLAIEAGAGLRFLRPTPRLGLWLQLELGVGRDAMTHFSPDDAGPAERTHWIPVSTGSLGVTFRIAPTLALTLDLGTDVVWGTTQVILRGERRAELSPLRPRATLGFAAGF